jgi:hypothetical protein
MQSSERGGGSGSMLDIVSVGFSSRYLCLSKMLRFLVRNRRRVGMSIIGKDFLQLVSKSLVYLWFYLGPAYRVSCTFPSNIVC